MKNFFKVTSIAMSIIFTIAYTATVLPFTVRFFKHIATPSAASNDLLPLDTAHLFLMPVFLVILEFASIWLVTRAWTDNKDRWIALILFFCCQCLPVTSVYFDSRHKDFIDVKAHFEQTKAELCTAIQTRIDGINSQIATIDKDLTVLKSDRSTNSAAIMKLILSKRKKLDNTLKEEVQSNASFRQQRETEISEATKEKKKQTDLLALEIKNLAAAKQSKLPYRSEIEFIIATVFTPNSYPSLYFAALFPVTLLAVGFFLSRNRSQTATASTAHFNLDCHLENVVASLPPEMHAGYAKSLVPPLEAHLSVFKASRELVIETDHLYQNHALTCDFADQVQHLNTQVARSKLEEGAKNQLAVSLKQILEHNLFQKEVSNHV